MLRTRIGWLVAATTSAIIVAFVIPLALLVRTLAEDRGMASARQDAQNAAILVATVSDPRQLADTISLVSRGAGTSTSVLMPDGTVIGSSAGSVPPIGRDPYVKEAASTGRSFTQDVASGAEVLIPVAVTDGQAVVRTTVDDATLREGVATAWLIIAGLGALLFSLALLSGLLLGRRLSRPVTNLAEVAHRLRSGDLAARADLGGPAEVVELGRALNRLAERIEELLVAEREAVADLSHRLRTPVTALKLDAEQVQDPQVAERLRTHVDHVQRTVDRIVADARRPVRESLSASGDLVAAVSDRVRYWRPLAEDQRRPLTSSLPEHPFRVALSSSDLHELVDTLIDNVFAHTPEGTALALDVAHSGSSRVALVVTDSGPGLTPSDHPRRGSSGSGSSGLGLDIVRRLTRSAGGSLEILSPPTGGTRVVVRLPLVEPAERTG